MMKTDGTLYLQTLFCTAFTSIYPVTGAKQICCVIDGPSHLHHTVRNDSLRFNGTKVICSFVIYGVLFIKLLDLFMSFNQF